MLKTTQLSSLHRRKTSAENKTGLPDNLKEGAERICGLDLSDIRVSYNSPAPARLKARAFARGDQIHLAPGAERHLPHELWHSVQQRQGRVRADRSVAGVPVSDSATLEHEADLMGRRAMTAPMAGGGCAAGPGAPGDVAQLVGEDKFVISKLDPNNVADAWKIKPSMHELKMDQRDEHAKVVNDLFERVRAERKRQKAQALAEFKQAGFDNSDAQKRYEARLKELQLSSNDLFNMKNERNEKILEGYNKKNGYITHNGTPVAKILEGDDAYTPVAPPATPRHSAVFKRKTFDGGLSAKDFVNVGGKYLRRYAYRGVTPPERDAMLGGNPLLPANANNRQAGSTGYNYDKVTGAARPRPDKGENNVTNNDLEWLREKSDQPHKSIPNDPAVLSLLQSRKGAGKLLSARSTPRPITSNHGASFSEWGEVEIDLAHVPTANIYDHYKSGGLSLKAIADKLDEATPNKKRMNQSAYQQIVKDVSRSNATVRRNREIMFTEIPAAAARLLPGTVDPHSPAGSAYRDEARRIYREAYAVAYAELSGQQGPGPAPENYPDMGEGLRASEATGKAASLQDTARRRAADDFQRRQTPRRQPPSAPPYGGHPMQPSYGVPMYPYPATPQMTSPYFNPYAQPNAFPPQQFGYPPYTPYPPHPAHAAMGYQVTQGGQMRFPPPPTGQPEPASGSEVSQPPLSDPPASIKAPIKSKLVYKGTVFKPRKKGASGDEGE